MSEYQLIFDSQDLKDLVYYIENYNKLQLDSLKDGDILNIDMINVDFISAPGILFLLMLIKTIYKKTKQKIQLINISKSNSSIFAYLERTDFFKLTKNWCIIDDSYSDAYLFARTNNSKTIMELQHINKNNFDDEFNLAKSYIINHAQNILSDLFTIDKFLKILGELACNIQQWSEGDGYFLIQKYSKKNETYICIADDGIGIYDILKKQKSDIDNKKPLNKLKSEKDFFEFAFSELAPRSSSGGLDGIQKIIKNQKQGSRMIGISGNYLYFYNNLMPNYTTYNMPYSFIGTMIIIIIK